MKRLLPLTFAAVLASGCTHSIHLQHVSDIDPALAQAKQTRTVVAIGEQVSFLGLSFDTDYVDQAHQQLLEQCAGPIGAVATQFSTSHGLLHWTNKVRMQGVCID